EMGKPLADSRAEIEKSALTCEFYAENGARFLENETIETQHLGSFVSYEPLGVIFALMPWNYPFWQVFRFLAPALMVGNGAILKHADNTPLCALAAQEIFEKAGGPEGLFSAIFV